MRSDYTALKNRRFADVRQRYGAADSMLYALGIGMGADPQDLDQLRYVYEPELRAVPTMAVVLGCPGFWMRAPDTGLDWQRILHVEQTLTLHRGLKPSGEVVGKTAIESIVDRRGKGAFITTRRDIFDADTSEHIASTSSTMLCRSDSISGASGAAAPTENQPREEAPDFTCVLPSFAQSALIYRLSGDDNPLHADIRVAQQAGFERPILHGLCTFGMVGHAALRMLWRSARISPSSSAEMSPWRTLTAICRK